MLLFKKLQREFFPPRHLDPHGFQHLGWDDPVPPIFDKQWNNMTRILQEVQAIKTPRSFYPAHEGKPLHQELHGFADASDEALCYVIYIRTVTDTGKYM